MQKPRRIAIIGGGVAGLAAAYELAKLARDQESVHVALFEASSRLGGIVETVREGGFVIEGGPDGWVSEKPWARELAVELGLEEDLIYSSDEQRRTYVLIDGILKAMPNGMRMMVPADLDALDASDLFSDEARRAFHQEILRAEELKTLAPDDDESVAQFVRRHFGDEVLEKIGAPLLSGVFGGDVKQLSVRAVMAPFVALEREYGSLILGLQAREAFHKKTPLFTTLRSGVGALIDRMAAAIPQDWIHPGTRVTAIAREDNRWIVTTDIGQDSFDTILMAAPLHVARELMQPVDAKAAALMQMDASSAVVVGFGFDDAEQVPVPQGFGFLVPPDSNSSLLLACTFMDQKFPGRVPPGGRLLRAFFGGRSADRVLKCGNDEIAAIARMELARILGPLPEPRITVIRRLPLSLPQYAVGTLERMQELQDRVNALQDFYLLGNGYRGVGLPDLVRDSRAAARFVLER